MDCGKGQIGQITQRFQNLSKERTIEEFLKTVIYLPCLPCGGRMGKRHSFPVCRLIARGASERPSSGLAIELSTLEEVMKLRRVFRISPPEPFIWVRMKDIPGIGRRLYHLKP